MRPKSFRSSRREARSDSRRDCTVYNNLLILSGVALRVKETVSKIIPKNVKVLEGVNSDFFSFRQKPSL